MTALLHPGLHAAAAALVHHRASGLALSGFPGPLPASLDAAYSIQAAAISAWDRPVAGWKVGLISQDFVERFGEARFIGPIFSDSVVHTTFEDVADFRVICGGTGLVEAELVARIEQADDGHFLATAWHVGFEVAGSPIANIGQLGSLASIAAFGNNIGLILGPKVAVSDPADVACTVEIDGHQRGSDTGARLPGGPDAAIAFATQKLADIGMCPGGPFYISTGAITGAHPVAAGQRISARFSPGGLLRATAVPF